MLSTENQPVGIWKPVYDWFNDETRIDAQIMIVSLGLVLLVLSTTYAEIIELAAGGAACESSGCDRSYAAGFFLELFIIPSFMLLQYQLVYWLLKKSLWQNNHLQSPTQRRLLSLLPFSPSLMLYPLLMNLIYQGGAQTDLTFLLAGLMKVGLCVLNIITLVFALRYFCGVRWLSAMRIACLPSAVFACIAAYHLFNLMPYWHLLNEDQAYLSLQHFLLSLLH